MAKTQWTLFTSEEKQTGQTNGCHGTIKHQLTFIISRGVPPSTSEPPLSLMRNMFRNIWNNLKVYNVEYLNPQGLCVPSLWISTGTMISTHWHCSLLPSLSTSLELDSWCKSQFQVQHCLYTYIWSQLLFCWNITWCLMIFDLVLLLQNSIFLWDH